MDRPTVDLYERQAARYRERRSATGHEWAGAVAEGALSGRPVLDAGCGPGIYTPFLGESAVGLDAARAMLELASEALPGLPVVQGDLAALPFRSRSLGGCWARQSYLHLRRADLPAALADLHRSLAVAAPTVLVLLAGPGDGWRPPNDDFPGRFFAGWARSELVEVMEGAGFEVRRVDESGHKLRVEAVRTRSLADTVGEGMRVLVCGLNPSLHAADSGVGYAGPGNRFWRAAVEAGLVEQPLDPWAALRAGVGMTDLVKRATPRAADVTRDEFRAGGARVERLVRWLEPRVVCFVGLGGYRAAVDPKAAVGWQDAGFGGVATYVMPSTSGLNARTPYDDIVRHLRAVVEAARRVDE